MTHNDSAPRAGAAAPASALFLIIVLLFVTPLLAQPAANPAPGDATAVQDSPAAPSGNQATTPGGRRGQRNGAPAAANQADDDEEGSQSREERDRWRQRSLQDYEPDMKGRPERLNDYVRIFKEKAILNFKSIPCDVKAEPLAGGGVALEGDVLYAEHKAGIQTTLESLGFSPIQNNIIVLPDAASLGDKAFAIATTATLSLWREPRVRSEQVNQVLLGAPLRLLKKDKDGKFYFAQSHDDYVGWVETSHVLAVDKAQWTLWRGAWPKAVIQRPVPLQKFLPLTHHLHDLNMWEGTALPVKKNGLEDEIVLPGGEKIPLARLQRGVDFELLDMPNADTMRERLRAMAEPYMGVRYRWGGITPAGFDCSGFTRHIYQKLNVYLGRDADQQAVSGELVAFRGYREGLLPGDLLFFVGRRGNVSHVAMSLGGMDYVHSAGRGVHYASFEPESPLYNKGYDDKFAFAKRVLPRGLPPAPVAAQTGTGATAATAPATAAPAKPAAAETKSP